MPSAVRLEGNRALAASEVIPGLGAHEATRGGGRVDSYVAAQDVERLRVAYARRGYFAAQIAVRVEPSPAGEAVVFTVREGPRATTQLALTGVPSDVGAIRLALRDGAPFAYDAYDAGKLALRAALEDAGYARAEVRASVTADGAIARVRYEVVAGERCTFGALRIVGTAQPQLIEAVRAHVRFAPGDRYAPAALAASQHELFALGRFASVQLTPRPGAGAAIDIEVAVSEATRHELHVGIGVGVEPESDELRLRPGGSWFVEGQPLLELAAEARLAYSVLRDGHDVVPDDVLHGDLKLQAQVSATKLDLWKPRLRGSLEAGFDVQTVEAYTWQGGHVRGSLASPVGAPWLQLRVGAVLEALRYSHVDDALEAPWGASTIREALGLDRAQRRGAYEASLVADLRDSASDPHRGLYIGVPAVWGTEYAAGELAYYQVTPELRGYVPLGDAVLAARGRVGTIVGDAPVTERFYSGGPSGQRGFSARQLSPRAPRDDDPKGVVIGGTGLIETGVELRVPLWMTSKLLLGSNAFLDGGDVTRTPSELDLSKLYWAAGLGVWAQLGGLGGLKLRLEGGRPLNRVSESAVFHLGVGEAF